MKITKRVKSIMLEFSITQDEMNAILTLIGATSRQERVKIFDKSYHMRKEPFDSEVASRTLGEFYFEATGAIKLAEQEVAGD